jgi:hypothetical protein
MQLDFEDTLNADTRVLLLGLLAEPNEARAKA